MNRPAVIFGGLFFLLFFLFLFYARPAEAEPWFGTWGGHIRLQAQGSGLDSTDYMDGAAEFRLKAQKKLFSRFRFVVHYEAVGSGGGLYDRMHRMADTVPGVSAQYALYPTTMSDDRRLMDLTRTLHDGRHWILYHRLDRLFISYRPDWGAVRLGRQAVTWGDGRLFNPMDLFNPFSPTDIVRDYKIGDDMLNIIWTPAGTGEYQILCVPRRDPETGKLRADQSSLAVRHHLFYKTTEFDLMAAAHYDAAVFGLGSRGYLGDAGWWMDATWQNVPHSRVDSYFSITTGMDDAWTRWGKNIYGFIEFYYNGLGKTDVEKALYSQALMERISRGEIYTLGRYYMGGQLQVELHPLVNAYVTAMMNLSDGSGILQPRLRWSTTENIMTTFGCNAAFGGPQTEFGGIDVPGTGTTVQPADSIYIWITDYF